MTIEDLLMYLEAIDTKDDERRKKSFNLDKWNEDKQKGFSRERKELLKLDDLTKMRNGFVSLDKKVDEFNVKYLIAKKKIQALELHYEDLDDKTRRTAIEFLVRYIELSKDENFKINLTLIKENFENKQEKNLKIREI
jgi:hypothetical protein